MNALEIIGVWFENLPSELQAELSGLLSAMLPEFLACGGNASSFDDGTALLGRALVRRPGANAVLVTGRATALAAAIDFIFSARQRRRRSVRSVRSKSIEIKYVDGPCGVGRRRILYD